MTEQPVDVLQHVRIEVHRIDEAMIREALGQRRDRLADLFDALAEILAAVAGDEHDRHLRPVGAEH